MSPEQFYLGGCILAFIELLLCGYTEYREGKTIEISLGSILVVVTLSLLSIATVIFASALLFFKYIDKPIITLKRKNLDIEYGRYSIDYNS